MFSPCCCYPFIYRTCRQISKAEESLEKMGHLLIGTVVRNRFAALLLTRTLMNEESVIISDNDVGDCFQSERHL